MCSVWECNWTCAQLAQFQRCFSCNENDWINPLQLYQFPLRKRTLDATPSRWNHLENIPGFFGRPCPSVHTFLWMVGRWSFRSSCTGESPFIAIQIFELPEKREGKYKDFYLIWRTWENKTKILLHFYDVTLFSPGESFSKLAVLDIGGNSSLKRVHYHWSQCSSSIQRQLTESGY